MPIVRTQSNMANRQRALTLLVLLFEELFDITAERELQELSDDETEDLLLLVLLGNHGFPVNRVRVVGYFEVVVPSYRLDDFRSHFRMSRDSVSFIEGLLGVCPEIPHQAHGHGGKAPVELRKQILITVWILANPECLRSVSDRFNISRSTCYEVYQRICTAIVDNLVHRFIHLPEGDNARNTIQKFEEQRGFPGVLGAIDGSHIPIEAPIKDPEQYINRKGFHSLQLQVVCDMEMMFIDVFCGFPGSVHDARVFRNSPLFIDAERNRDQLFPGNSHLIGDAAYPLKPWILTPYRDTGRLTRQQLRYNFLHSSTRMVVERSLALLKGRFRKLKTSMLKQRIQDVPVIVVAACVLHNICLMTEDDIDDFLDDGDGEDDSDDDDGDDGLFFFPRDTEGEEKRRQITRAL